MKKIFPFLLLLVSYNNSYSNIPAQPMGVTYNGLHASTNPTKDSVIQDLTTIQGQGITAVRTYYPQYSGQIALMPLMEEYKINTMLGLYMFPDHLNDWVPDNYKNYIVPYLNEPNLTGVLIGNENFGDNNAINDSIKKYLQQVKTDSPSTPVSTAQTTHFWLNDNRAPEVAKLCDFIAVNIYPVMDWHKPDPQNQPIASDGKSLTVEDGFNSFIDQYEQVKNKYPNKQIVVTEVGWPTTYGWVVNVPQQPKQYQIGLSNADAFYNKVKDWANTNGVVVYYYSMFDNRYGVDTSSQFNFHFGRLDTNRKPKVESN